MFFSENKNFRLSGVWMPFRCWYHNSQSGTRIFKVQRAIVFSNDTDILSLLLHHYHNTPNLKDIFLPEMTRKSSHQQRKCYSIREVISQFLKRGEPTLPYLLFAYAFTGCGMSSAIYRFGKTSIFKKLNNLKQLRNITDIFYKDGQNPCTIQTAAIRCFWSFSILGFVKRNTMVG